MSWYFPSLHNLSFLDKKLKKIMGLFEIVPFVKVLFLAKLKEARFISYFLGGINSFVFSKHFIRT